MYFATSSVGLSERVDELNANLKGTTFVQIPKDLNKADEEVEFDPIF